MSNLSVRKASEAAIGIATLRHFASTPDDSPRLDSMAGEILGGHSAARTIRTTINTLAEREHEWIKERATHATISSRVNERRERELSSMVAVYAAALSTLQLSPALRSATEVPQEGQLRAMEVLQESYVSAMEGIDQFPMGTNAKQALRSQLLSEAELAVPESSRAQVGTLMVQAEQTYLKRYAESVYAHYDEPDNDASPSM